MNAPEPAATPAAHCHVGSCQRHGQCMYVPCRATEPSATTTAAPSKNELAQRHTDAVRKQRAAYFAWQNEPAGQDAARLAYVEACKELRGVEAAMRKEAAA